MRVLSQVCLEQWGTEEQKQRYLPRLTSGDWIGCYCLTEPDAGSDAANIQTIATADGEDYLLNGEKIWITNGNMARLAIVFATRDRAERHKGICAFLVETDTPGLRREQMPGVELGHRASDHAHITLRELPHSGQRHARQAGRGLQNCHVGAGSRAARRRCGCGGHRRRPAWTPACLWARERRQFGQRLGDFQMVQATIANMAADIDGGAAAGLSRRVA